MVARAEGAERLARAPRIGLSPLDPRHADTLFELLNDWDVVRMLSEVPWPLRREDVASFLSSEHAATDDFIMLAGREPIGVCAVKKPGSGNPPRKMPRLGYWIGQKYWGRGYGTEAIGALVDRAFDTYPVERVGAGIFHDNPASRRVLEKLGFSKIGTGLAGSVSRGREVETIEMQVTRAEWSAARAKRP